MHIPTIPLTITATGTGHRTDGVLVGVMVDDLNRVEQMAYKLAEALRLTQEYVGSGLLPPIEGWSWFDALSEFYGEPFVPADQRPAPERDPNEVAVAMPADA